MRGGLATIQQTLTPEASAVLTASVSEAARRNHGQTTPLHVASTLLSSPSGFLRNACVRSHPNSSHPLQCRALELCFSVALDRLPATILAGSTAEAGGAAESAPPVSNALMAALKRAQANQRRGCPEQQQQPLLAVKVELEHLVISILDDPSVSRVMREASFSSPAVKTAIEKSISIPGSSTACSAPPPPGFRPGGGMYMNPRLQLQQHQLHQQHRNNLVAGNGIGIGNNNEDVKRVLDIMSRPKKRNPVLVGESEPASVMEDVRGRLERGEVNEYLRNIDVVRLENKAKLADNIRELWGFVEERGEGARVVLDMGDLKWLVEAGRAVVDEVSRVVARFGERGNGRMWLIGTATCETYLRCQVYYPTMENDWDLQAVPITPRSPFPGLFPRLGGNATLNTSVEHIIPMKTFQGTNTIPRRVPENLNPARPSSRCPQCTENYEQELAKLVAKEYEISSSEVRSKPAAGPPLPQWLQNAKFDNNDARSPDKSQTKDQETVFKQKTEDLQKKWSDTCLRVHPSFHNILGSQRPQMTLYNPKLLLNQPLQNRLLANKSPGLTLQLNSGPKNSEPVEKLNSPPRSPVRTDLALGGPKVTEPTLGNTENNRVKDLLGCISSEFQVEKFAKALDTDTYKRLLKGLLEKVWWQKEAASKVASAVTKCRGGNSKRRGNLSKGDTWILFTGSDKVGKKKMASVISEQICQSNPISICMGRRRSDEEIAMNFRGKTVLDRIVEAVKRNPFSVIMLEDIDEADMIIRGSIKRAMERGRLADSYGREISLGNIIFILTANWLPDNIKKISSDQELDENKLELLSSGGWNLRLRISEKRTNKRKPDWLHDGDRLIKPRRELGSGLSLDLNLMADFNEDRTDGSDLTDDNQIRRCSITSVPIELANFIDEAVVFKPVEAFSVRNEIKNKILEKFSSIVDDVSLEVEEEALEKVLGGVWLGRTGLEEWGEKVLLPSFHQIKTFLPSATSSDENFVVRLEIDSDSDSPRTGDWLPSSIKF